MKPAVFIGSSREAEPIATPIQAKLGWVAECTPWTSGVFDISEMTLASLTAALHNSDFGIFVFAEDDLVESRSQVLTAPRYNVIYETGMFAGHLGFNRCFIAERIPQLVDKRSLPRDRHR
jgi:predicted nucleotide-binding protein